MTSVGLPLRLAEVTRLPARSLRSNGGIGGDRVGTARHRRHAAQLHGHRYRAAIDRALHVRMGTGPAHTFTNPEEFTGVQSRFRYSSFADGASSGACGSLPRRLRVLRQQRRVSISNATKTSFCMPVIMAERSRNGCRAREICRPACWSRDKPIAC